jgi:hypothetical protein
MKLVKIHDGADNGVISKPNVFHTLHFNTAAGISNYNSYPHPTFHHAQKSAAAQVHIPNTSYTHFIIIEVDPN